MIAEKMNVAECKNDKKCIVIKEMVFELAVLFDTCINCSYDLHLLF